MSGIVQDLSFGDWLISFGITPSRSIHVITGVRMSFFFLRLNNVPPYRYVSFCLSIQPSPDTWVASTFWLL